MKKHRVVGPVLGVGGMVGVLGEEGVSWTSSIVTHFSVNACIMIDQSKHFFEIFLLIRRFLPRFAALEPLWQ